MPTVRICRASHTRASGCVCWRCAHARACVPACACAHLHASAHAARPRPRVCVAVVQAQQVVATCKTCRGHDSRATCSVITHILTGSRRDGRKLTGADRGEEAWHGIPSHDEPAGAWPHQAGSQRLRLYSTHHHTVCTPPWPWVPPWVPPARLQHTALPCNVPRPTRAPPAAAQGAVQERLTDPLTPRPDWNQHVCGRSA